MNDFKIRPRSEVEELVTIFIVDNKIHAQYGKDTERRRLMLPDEMEAEKNRKIILAQADEIEILKRNVKELQQSLQNAYADISRLAEEQCNQET